MSQQSPGEELGPGRPEATSPREARTSRAGLSGMSLRTRVSLLIMAAVGITVMIAAIASYVIIRDTITNRLDQKLMSQAKLSVQIGAAEPKWLESNVATTTLYLAGLQETLLTANALQITPPVVSANPNGVGPPYVNAAAPWGAPEVAVAAGQSPSSVRTIVTHSGAYRVVAIPAGDGSNLAVVLATSMSTTQDTLNVLGLVSILVGLVGIGVAGIAGFWIGRTALRPVEKLTVATEYIARTGDLRQIEVTGSDELARLTASFNTMLLALARSQEYQKRLVADAGHELRTPLTSIRTNLDLLAQATAEPDNQRLTAQDRTDLMTDVRAQMEELSVLIADLVELSRDERTTQSVEDLDFADVVDRAVQRVQRRAPSLVYDIRLESWFLRGEPAALERMVTNLLDNAAKWSPPGGTVTVRLHEGALHIADQGPGIAEQDLKHVFERFFRSAEARTMPGSGLGLAIVRQVAEHHGGRVAAARAQGGGALLGVWLPGSVTAPGEDTRSDDLMRREAEGDGAVRGESNASWGQAGADPATTAESHPAENGSEPFIAAQSPVPPDSASVLGEPSGASRSAARPDAQ